MIKIVNVLKKYMYLVAIFLTMSIVLSVTYSNFIVTSNDHKAAEMYIGELKYSIRIDSNETNTLTVEPGVTIIDVDVNNLNPVDTYYKLLYLKNTNITVKYYESTKDTDDVVTTYNKPNDSITSSNSNTIKLLITNNSTSSQNIALTMKGGYITNTIQDIVAPSTYSEITLVETPSTNTYFCKTSDTLTQGLEYVNGQYTYGYKKEGEYVKYPDIHGIDWSNITTEGWGVQLTDKVSTDAVTSKLCTYINNKPVVSMSHMFSYSKATTLNVSNFNTSNVTNMRYMFFNSQATTLDLSSFDTSNVTNMLLMFDGSQAATLDLSSFDTSNVTNMKQMFYESQATALDLSSFNTSNVTDMGGMFSYSKATTIKGLENFDTSKVTSMSHMFWYSKAISIDLSNFDTSKVTNMHGMFDHSQATTLDLSNFDTSNVTNMGSMFCGSQATALDLSSFNTSNVTNMHAMFENSQATTLDLSNFDTSKVTDMGGMFYGSKAKTIDLSSFNTSNVTYMASMFFNSQATTLDLSSFDTSKVTSMYDMFNGSKATTLDLSNFDTSKVTNMSYMFYNSKATTLDVSNFDTSNVTNMYAMFENSQATTLDLSNFDTSKVTDMSSMFYNSSKLKTIYISDKFNTNVVTSSTNMFYSCTSLVGGSGTKYNSSYIDKTYARIDGGTSSPGYFTDIADKSSGPNSFATDSWSTIINAVKDGNISKYNVGDIKEIDMGSYGTHTLRIANTTTPSECSTSGFSQTACGFVLEFVDVITNYQMNSTSTNSGGWPSTSMRAFVNNDIYNSLPSDLKSAIITTTVVSGHGSSGSSNFTSTDKLYLLATKEIYRDWSYSYDTAYKLTRTLDYYTTQGVTTSKYSGAIKKTEVALLVGGFVRLVLLIVIFFATFLLLGLGIVVMLLLFLMASLQLSD